jgi:hypothetical protein
MAGPEPTLRFRENGLMIRGAVNSTRVEAATDDAAFIARPPRG